MIFLVSICGLSCDLNETCPHYNEYYSWCLKYFKLWLVIFQTVIRVETWNASTSNCDLSGDLVFEWNVFQL